MIQTGTVGAIVAAARGRLGLTLRELSGRLGVSYPYLHDVEHGRRALAPERWGALVTALEGLTSLEELASAAVEGMDHVEVPREALTPQQRAEAEQALVGQARAALAARAA